jgi:outer membrane receptor protein involved in Fe transport
VNQKTEISVTQSVFSNTVASLPEWQNTYGGGFHQSTGFAFYSNWGSKFKSPPEMLLHPYSRAAYSLAFPELQGQMIPNQAAVNNVNDFFRTGWINTSSINISGSPSANTNLSANYTYYNDKGFTPGNDLRKHSFGFGGSTKLTNRFTLAGTLNFGITDYQTPPNSASTGSGPQYANYPGIFADIMYTPRSIDLMNWPFENPLDGSSVYYRPGNDIQNPRWTAKYVKAKQNVQRTYGQISMRYDILKNLNLMYRIGLDNYSEENSLQAPKGGVQVPLGLYRTTNGKSAYWDHTVIGQFNTDISKDWDLSTTFGGNYLIQNYNQVGIFSTNQLVFNIFNHNNFINSSPRGESGANLNNSSEMHQKGVFAEGVFGFRDYMYITLGGRKGWVSTLEKANNSQFYPSTSISFIPTAVIEALKSNDWINFTKLRLGYGTSARFPETPYTTRAALNIGSNVFADRAGGIINTNSIPNLLPNPDLKPELLKEFEFGLEGRFIKNRLNIDFTYYNRKATDQILFRQLDPATGYSSQQINGGDVVNKGIEIGLGLNIIRDKDFTWGIDVNYTRNRNKVTRLPNGIDQLVVAGFTDLGGFAKVGYPLGIMQGYYVQRYTSSTDPKAGGQLIVDGLGNYLSSTNIGIIGDPNPDYKASLTNNLVYKGLSFRMQWDYTQGGDIYSATIRSLLARGLTKDTEMDRMLPVILPGVKQDGTPNNIQTDATNAYFNSLGFGPADRSVFDGTVVRLREVSLSYALPAKMLNKTPFGGVSLTLSGSNLWYKSPNTPQYMNFDPETSGLGAGSYRGFEFITGPSSRRIGGSLRITF